MNVFIKIISLYFCVIFNVESCELSINDHKPLYLHRKVVNKTAPKGGTLRLAGVGSFDNLNMFSSTGVPFPYLWMCYETLLFESTLEQGILYPWLCSKVDYDLKRVTFHLKDDVTFHSGKKLKADDIKKTFEILQEKGAFRFQATLKNVKRIEVVSDKVVVVHIFPLSSEREIKLFIRQLAQIPILSADQLSQISFEQSGMTVLDGTGPYYISKAMVGKMVEMTQYEKYWGKDHLDGVGKNNFSKINIDLYKNQDVCYQSFLAKKFDVFFETNPKRWKKNYLKSKHEKKFATAELNLKKPWAVRSIVLNLRKGVLKDENLRKAILMLIDSEYMNHLFFGNDMQEVKDIISVFKNQIQTHDLDVKYFQKSEFDSFSDQALISQLRAKKSWNDIWSKIKEAKRTLLESGYSVRAGQLYTPQDLPVCLKVMLKDSNLLKLANFLKFLLKKIGVSLEIILFDSIVYESELAKLDFDLLFYSWLQIDNVDLKKSFDVFKSVYALSTINISGIQDASIDQSIEDLLSSNDPEKLEKKMDGLKQKIENLYAIKTLFSDNKIRIMYWPDRVNFPRLHPLSDMNIMSRGWCSSGNP